MSPAAKKLASGGASVVTRGQAKPAASPSGSEASAAAAASDAPDARGRKLDRDGSDNDRAAGAASGDDEDKKAGASKTGTGERKRKRSRKGLDKKYLCPHDGCGKSYSRAEHLYRHQLNHTPKTIYRCDYPDCPRMFVRQDLCARHRERHTTRGSHLQRKDNFVVSGEQAAQQPALVQHNAQPPPEHVPQHQHQHQPNDLSLSVPLPYNNSHNAFDVHPGLAQSPPGGEPQSMTGHPRTADSVTPSDPFRSPPSSYNAQGIPAGYSNFAGMQRANGDTQYYGDVHMTGQALSPGARNAPVANFDTGRPQHMGSLNSTVHRQQSTDSHGFQSPEAAHASPAHYRAPQPFPQYGAQAVTRPGSSYNGYVPHQQFPSMPALPPPTYPAMSLNGPFQPQQTQQYYAQQEMGAGRTLVADELAGIAAGESPLTDGSMPLFDSEGYTRSPVVMADNFAAWLFNDPQMGNGSTHRRHDSSMLDPSLRHSLNASMPLIPPQHSMAVTSILGSAPTNSILSEEKRQLLLELIERRFNETSHSPVAQQKEALLAGDRDQESHVLSLRMMQTYIGSYWYHFHDQMPILHRPTFSADKAQNLLLIAIIAIGAANLDKVHGEQVTAAGAELANFLAWHLRGELFNDQDFRPPARLWVLQTLLLLECYEKLYSSRILHERSQIHHATTISLLRRGSALLGRSAMDSPPSLVDHSNHHNKYSHDNHHINSSDGRAASIADTPDPWWNHWITNEATKRIAFAAFIVDSIHATMFSHTAVMLAHEMRLPLPCDETLWTATSGMEVGRIEQDLQTRGVKPISFLDGLKATLNGRHVRTNVFGRTAIMAGLLNVSFHLGQRDLQVRSIGVIGGKDVWRGSLTKAYDIWERHWEEEGSGGGGGADGNGSNGGENGNSSLKQHHLSSSHTNGGRSTSTTGTSPSSAKPQSHSQPSRPATALPKSFATTKDEAPVFESRVVLHHLAHMGMHVDIVQCQIFARAKRLLGRTITPPDYASAVRRMREVWAPKASARDAVFYSLKFLTRVLAPDLYRPATAAVTGLGGEHHRASGNGAGPGVSPASTTGPATTTSKLGANGMDETGDHLPSHHHQSLSAAQLLLMADEYSPRDDYLLNRPWVLYFAALVVWSYGYALDGPLLTTTAATTTTTTTTTATGSSLQQQQQQRGFPRLDTREQQLLDMRAYLRRVGGVRAPDDLAGVADRNACAGLLVYLQGQFRKCRWELMHEGATLLGNCVEMLRGG